MVNLGVDGYTKFPNQPKIFRKTQKYETYWKTTEC